MSKAKIQATAAQTETLIHTKNVKGDCRSVSPIPATSRQHSSTLGFNRIITQESEENNTTSNQLVGEFSEPESLAQVISPDPSGCQNSKRKSVIESSRGIMTKKKKIVLDRWKCDICHVAVFDDYEEACRHEELCTKHEKDLVEIEVDVMEDIDSLPEEALNSPEESVVIVVPEKSDANASKCEKRPKRRTQQAMKREKKKNPKPQDDHDHGSDNDRENEGKDSDSPIVIELEDTPMIPKKLTFSVPEKKNRIHSPCHFDSCEVCCVDATQRISRTRNGSKPSSVGTKQGHALKEKSSKSKKPIAAKSTKSTAVKSTKSTAVKSTKSAAVKSTKATAAKSTKATAAKSTKSAAVQGCTDAASIADKKPVRTAPVFLKNQKSKGPVQSNVASAASDTHDPKTANQDKTPRTLAFASIFQKSIRKNVSNDQMDCVVSDQSSPTVLSEQQQKAILAEHRAAEFASKRRKQLEEERERQKKRDENRKLNYQSKQSKKQSNVIMKLKARDTEEQTLATIVKQDQENTAPSKRRKGNRGETIENSLIRTERHEQGEALKSVTTKMANNKFTSCIDLSRYPPRFPNPSHVIDTSTTSGCDGLSLLNHQEYDAFVSVSRHAQSMDSASFSDLPLYTYNIDHDENTANEDYLFMYFSSVLYPCKPRGISGKKEQDYNQLWSEKYTMQALPHSVYGETNKEVAEDLISFIHSWKDHRQQVCDARAEKAAKLRGVKKKTKKRSKSSGYDDDDDFLSDDEDSGLRSVYLLTGESGSGKTSLAHAAAKHCQCVLIEINTSSERGGKALKKEIEECSQSLSNLASMKKDNILSGGILLEEDDDASQGPCLSVILIDEVDLLFESDGDAGFWQSLSSVAKKSKCPIILTATNVPTQLKNSSIQYEHSILVRPLPYECVSKMTQIAKMEGMKWKKDISGEEIKKGMATIAKLCDCDLRKIMNEMQVYALGNMQSCNLNIQPNSDLHYFGQDNLYNSKYFSVDSVTPRVVPSSSYSVITIKGRNFTKDGKSNIMVGDQVSLSRIIDENTILAVVPPCNIRSGVDTHGLVQHSLYEESLDTRYAQMTISIKCKNDVLSRSDSSATYIKPHDLSVPLPTFIEYSFDSQRADEDCFGRKELGSKIWEDADPNTLLEEAAQAFYSKTSETDDTYTTAPTAIISCSPTSATQQGTAEQVSDISRQYEYLSDMQLISDATGYSRLPLMSGAMRDFDDVLNHDISPLCGWEDPSLCRAVSNCYMTLPTSRRDRLLTAQEPVFSNSLSYCPDPINSAPEDDGSLDDFSYRYRALDNETFLSLKSDIKFDTLSRVKLDVQKYESATSMHAKSGIMKWQKDDNLEKTSYIIQPLMSDVRLECDILAEYCWLDYIPHLRKMAFIEDKADKSYAAICLDCRDDESQRKRRSTRRSTPKHRLHYFDLSLGNSCKSEKDFGRSIGEELARSHMQYNKSNNTYC